MPPQLWDWLINQGPIVVMLGLIIWALAKRGDLVPGYVYKREAERADRYEGLLLRNVRATERMADATETVVRSGSP